MADTETTNSYIRYTGECKNVTKIIEVKYNVKSAIIR